jgi:3-oxoacyl-[acyl-carrier protein] reductase
MILTMNLNLLGRVVVVTGGTSDLGRTMVRWIAQLGGVPIIGFRQNKDFAAQLATETNGIAISIDALDSQSVDSFSDQVLAIPGALWGLVVAAVPPISFHLHTQSSDQELLDQFEGNVMQLVRLTRRLAPKMAEHGGGRIIAISSENARLAPEANLSYASAKRALEASVEVLAKELGGARITVNSVAPGWMISDRNRQDRPDHPQEYVNQIALQRRGTDEDVAAAVSFLLSDWASFITGHHLPVDGGHR